MAEEQAERSVMHAKEVAKPCVNVDTQILQVTSEENTRAAKGTEELEAQLKAAQGAENKEEEVPCSSSCCSSALVIA